MWRKWWWRDRPEAFHYVRCSTWYSTVTTTKATNTITKKRQETVAMDHLHQSDTIRMQWWWQRQLLRDFDWCILQWRQCIFQNGQEKGALDGCCKSMVLIMTDLPIAHPEMNTSAVVMAALRWGGQGLFQDINVDEEDNKRKKNMTTVSEAMMKTVIDLSHQMVQLDR